MILAVFSKQTLHHFIQVCQTGIISYNTPVFDSEGHSLDIWLSMDAGEVDLGFVLASDHVRGHVLGNNGVLVDDLAAVGLQ